MRKATLAAAAASAVLSMVGCGSDSGGYQPKEAAKIPPASVKPGEERTLFPMTVGNQWTYSVEVQEVRNGQPGPVQTAELTWRVADVQKTDTGTNAVIDVHRLGEVTDRQEWRLTEKGLYQVASGKDLKPFSTPQPIIEFPVKAGSQFTWKGSGALPSSGSGPIETKNTVLAPMEVDTEIGRMSAIPVDTSVKFKLKETPGQGLSTIWLVPGVGMVRYHQKIAAGNSGAQFTMKLKSKSVK